MKLCPSFRRNKALKDNKTYRCKRHGYNIISSKKRNFSPLHVSIPVSLAYLSDIGNNQFSYLPLPERFNREKWVIILEIPVGALHSLISIHVKVALVIFFLTIFKFSLFWLHHKQQWYAWWPYVCYLAKYINMRYVDMRLIEKANATIWHAFNQCMPPCSSQILLYLQNIQRHVIFPYEISKQTSYTSIN